MHDSILFGPIQDQGQGHELLEFVNSTTFRRNLLRHFSSEIENDHRFWNYGTISKPFIEERFLISALVFEPRDSEI